MKLTGKNILVTGGAGFIGSHLVEALAKKNQITVYDNFSSPVISLSDVRNLGDVRVIKGDILDEKKLTEALRSVDIVFHLAVAGVRLSLSDPRRVHEVNATGTLTTLLAAKKAGVKRFVYVSSSEVYGGTKNHTVKESDQPHPTTVYGESKRTGELYTLLFHREEGLPSIVIRPFNTYGPRSHFEGIYGEVIPRTVIRVLTGKQPLIFGNGKQTRDFTYIDDTVKGIVTASQNDKLLGEIVNIARSQEVSILKVGKTICEIVGIPFRPIFKPARPHDVRRLAANTAKAKKLLHYSATISLKEGLQRYIDWVQKAYADKKQIMRFIPDKNW